MLLAVADPRPVGDAVLVGEENRGALRRIGFEATPRSTARVDVQAILQDDLERTGAIEY